MCMGLEVIVELDELEWLEEVDICDEFQEEGSEESG